MEEAICLLIAELLNLDAEFVVHDTTPASPWTTRAHPRGISSASPRVSASLAAMLPSKSTE